MWLIDFFFTKLFKWLHDKRTVFWICGTEKLNIFTKIKLDYIKQKNQLRWIIDLNVKATRDKLLERKKENLPDLGVGKYFIHRTWLQHTETRGFYSEYITKFYKAMIQRKQLKKAIDINGHYTNKEIRKIQMYIQKWSTWLVIRKTKIKTTMRHFFPLTKMAKI